MTDHSPAYKTRTAVAICFLLFELLMAIINLPLAGVPALSFLKGERSFKEMTEEITENYVSAKLFMRSEFINFNGLFARLCARHAYNDTILMKNGKMNYGYKTFCEEPNEQLTDNLAKAVDELDDYLASMDIPLYFVMAPVKEDLKGELLPESFHNYQNDTGDYLLTSLTESGIKTLDLRPYITPNAEQSGVFFYNTDHHWNGDGALFGFRIMMDYLRTEFDLQLDTSYTEETLWERNVLEKSFLGTHGKRVGKLYNGTDDLIWYEPKFDTEMSLSIPDYTEFYHGAFSEVNIREEYREKKDFYAFTPYVIYIGGDYPSVQHRNVSAPNKKKVLFIKDSFGLAIQSFLSTEFSEVDVIDPRYFTDAMIAEYCEWERPDLVVMMMSPSAVLNSYYTRVGISEEERKEIENQREQTLLSGLAVETDGQNTEETLPALPVKIINGKSYRVSLERVDPESEAPEAVSIVLYNKSIGEIAQQRIFDWEYYHNKQNWQWSFTVPNNDESEEFVLYICSGLFNTTENAPIEISGVSIVQLG